MVDLDPVPKFLLCPSSSRTWPTARAAEYTVVCVSKSSRQTDPSLLLHEARISPRALRPPPRHRGSPKHKSKWWGRQREKRFDPSTLPGPRARARDRGAQSSRPWRICIRSTSGLRGHEAGGWKGGGGEEGRQRQQLSKQYVNGIPEISHNRLLQLPADILLEQATELPYVHLNWSFGSG